LMVGVDVDHVLAESSESNNVSVVARVTPPLPDLTITNITQDTRDVNFTVTVQNNGPGTAIAGNLDVLGYYTASTDTTVFPPSGEVACIASIPTGTTLAPSAMLTVNVESCSGPVNSADNELMVGVNLSGQQRILEGSLTNNVAVVPLAPPILGSNTVSCSVSQGTTITWQSGTTGISYTFFQADATTMTGQGTITPPDNGPGSTTFQQPSTSAFVQVTWFSGTVGAKTPLMPCTA
jgi:hypothetical protein